MNKEIYFLLNVIKHLLNNKAKVLEIPDEQLDWERLMKFAKRHSILNLVYYGAEALPEKHRPDDAIYQYLHKQAMAEIVKNYNQLEAAKEILEYFEQQGIYVLAVKGVCTKHHYPQSDMRTMGDIDLLYRDSQHAEVKEAMQQLGYEGFEEGRKHDHYFRKPFIGVEMHRELVASDSIYNAYYQDVWNRVQPKENCQYVQEMSREDEYIYTIVHLVEHFKNGGIGMRFIMDIYVYNQMKDMDWDYLEETLKQLELWEFFRNLSALAQKWFGTEIKVENVDEHMLEKMEEYIIKNGTYGTRENIAAISITEAGRIKFLLKAFFPNLKNMQSMFPWLKKYPILLPFAWCVRGVRSVLFRRNNIRTQLNKYKDGDSEYGRNLKIFYKQCGL